LDGREVVAAERAGAIDLQQPGGVFLAQAGLAAEVVFFLGVDGDRQAGAVAQVDLAGELLAGVVGVEVDAAAADQVLVGGVLDGHGCSSG